MNIAENFKIFSRSTLCVLEITVPVGQIECALCGMVGARPRAVVFGPSFPVSHTASLELCTQWVSGPCRALQLPSLFADFSNCSVLWLSKYSQIFFILWVHQKNFYSFLKFIFYSFTAYELAF